MPPPVTRTATRGRTVRQQIQDAVKAIFVAMQDGTPAGAVWLSVEEGDVTSLDNMQAPIVGIEPSEEIQIEWQGACTEYRLTLLISFRFENTPAVEVYDHYEYYLGLLQQAVLVDRQLGGLAKGLFEVSNTPAIVEPNDPQPGGVWEIYVEYKTRDGDPYNAH